MQSPIEQKLRSITEDQRAQWLWDTKRAADAVQCHPRKFGDWWSRTRGKLIELGADQPGETAAELAALIAMACQLREKRQIEHRTSNIEHPIR
jgi:hypothetical protein